MIRSVFSKTIFSKRGSTVWWTVGIIGMVAFTMAFYPTLSKSFGESLKDVPDSLKSFIGDASVYSTISGYTDLQVFSQLVMIILVFGVILFSSLLAGDEAEGTLQTLLVQPVKRSKVYTEKYLAGAVLLFVASAGITVGILAALPLIHEHLGLARLLIATVETWLFCLVICTIAYVLGAITGRRGLSGGIAGIIAFVSLLVSTLSQSVKSLKFIDTLLPYHYFNHPGMLQYGPRWSDMMVLALSSLVLFAIGYIIFTKRDIYQN